MPQLNGRFHAAHQAVKDPAEYQSIYELDNAHRGFEAFDYDAVDMAIAKAEGRIYQPGDEDEDGHASREERYSLLAFIYYMLDQDDYRTRLDVAIWCLGNPYGPVDMREVLSRNRLTRAKFIKKAEAFKRVFNLTSRAHEAMVRFIALLISCKNYRLRLEVAIASLNIQARQGETFTSRAKKFGISKQAFTKHVLKFQKDFRLPPTREQKTLRARESYRIAASRQLAK
jgi:hypothetical protein